MNLLAALFMAQLLYVIGVGGVQVGNVTLTQFAWVFWKSIPTAEARKMCNFSWQCTKHAQYSALYIVLPQSLIKPDVSFQDGQDSYCTLPGYDTVQSDTTFRKNILPPFSVFNTDAGLLFPLIVDHCINVVRVLKYAQRIVVRFREKNKEEQHHQAVSHYNRPDFVWSSYFVHSCLISGVPRNFFRGGFNKFSWGEREWGSWGC